MGSLQTLLNYLHSHQQKKNTSHALAQSSTRNSKNKKRICLEGVCLTTYKYIGCSNARTWRKKAHREGYDWRNAFGLSLQRAAVSCWLSGRSARRILICRSRMCSILWPGDYSTARPDWVFFFAARPTSDAECLGWLSAHGWPAGINSFALAQSPACISLLCLLAREDIFSASGRAAGRPFIIIFDAS